MGIRKEMGIRKTAPASSVVTNGEGQALAREFTFSPERHWRLSISQYHRMIQAGILSENDRVELLEGWLIAKMPHNPPHDGTIHVIHAEVHPRLPQEWSMRIQSAVTLGKSEPEPDLAIVRGRPARFLKAHPGPADIGILMEVSDSTLLEDRIFKGRIYARALIPLYWLINLQDLQVEVYSEPKGGKRPSYSLRRNYGRRDTVPLILDGRQVARFPVQRLLPEQ
jgi:Uma2 family endonuclease